MDGLFENLFQKREGIMDGRASQPTPLAVTVLAVAPAYRLTKPLNADPSEGIAPSFGTQVVAEDPVLTLERLAAASSPARSYESSHRAAYLSSSRREVQSVPTACVGSPDGRPFVRSTPASASATLAYHLQRW